MISLSAEAPNEGELNKLYDRLNWQWWGGGLPKVPVRWSDRMHAVAGKYWVSNQGSGIVLSLAYHTRHPEEVLGTLLHEMIHAWMHEKGTLRPGAIHGPIFKTEADRVGAPLDCRRYSGMHRPYRYEWECPCCKRRSRSRIRAKTGLADLAVSDTMRVGTTRALS